MITVESTSIPKQTNGWYPAIHGNHPVVDGYPKERNVAPCPSGRNLDGQSPHSEVIIFAKAILKETG
jgi:hypothetical protein